MKKSIKIEIPDTLSSQQELIAVSKKLMKQALKLPSKKYMHLIGDSLTVKDIETNIIVSRVSNEKPITLLRCPVCGSNYQSNLAKHYYTNYGGNIRERNVCSKDCVVVVCEAFPGRTSASRKRLTPVCLF